MMTVTPMYGTQKSSRQSDTNECDSV